MIFRKNAGLCSVAVVKDHNKWSVTEHQRNSKTRTSMETIFWTQYTPLIDTYSTWVKSWTELIFLMAISSLWELSIIYLCGFESSFFFWGGGGAKDKDVSDLSIENWLKFDQDSKIHFFCVIPICLRPK